MWWQEMQPNKEFGHSGTCLIQKFEKPNVNCYEFPMREPQQY